MTGLSLIEVEPGFSFGSLEPSLITIRNAQPSDSDTIARLTDQLGYESRTEDISKRIAMLRQMDLSVLLVAEDESEVVGWVAARRHVALTHDPVAEVAGLVVDDNRRGEGVGRQLLAAVESWAISVGLLEVRLRANTKRLDAHRFYVREGYTALKEQVAFAKRLRA